MFKTKKYFVFLFLLIASIVLNGCNKNEIFEIKNTAQISSLKIKYNTQHSTKNFNKLSSSNTQKRLELFSEFGDVECVKINISGKINKSKNIYNLTPKDLEGNKIPFDNSSTAISYFSDSFQVKIKLPNSTYKVSIKDDMLPNSLSYSSHNFNDKYFKLNIEYLKTNVDKSIWKLNCNNDTNDCFIYIKFLNEHNEKIKDYFLNIIFDVKFT
ncbi:MAG: hypothetical protein IJ008_00915 [Clostridia bacterium]|nr:hypothetical protein [Clostridia bacterium]